MIWVMLEVHGNHRRNDRPSTLLLPLSCVQELTNAKQGLLHPAQQLRHLKSIVFQRIGSREREAVAAAATCVKADTTLDICQCTKTAAQAFAILRSQTDAYTAAALGNVFERLVEPVGKRPEERQLAIRRANHDVYVRCLNIVAIRTALIEVRLRYWTVKAVIRASKTQMATFNRGQQTFQQFTALSVRKHQIDAVHAIVMNHKRRMEASVGTQDYWDLTVLNSKLKADDGPVLSINTSAQTFDSSEPVSSKTIPDAVELREYEAENARLSCIQEVRAAQKAHSLVAQTSSRTLCVATEADHTPANVTDTPPSAIPVQSTPKKPAYHPLSAAREERQKLMNQLAGMTSRATSKPERLTSNKEKSSKHLSVSSPSPERPPTTLAGSQHPQQPPASAMLPGTSKTPIASVSEHSMRRSQPTASHHKSQQRKPHKQVIPEEDTVRLKEFSNLMKAREYSEMLQSKHARTMHGDKTQR
jgi:hypothetical protein